MRYKSLVPIGITLVLIALQFVYPYGTPGHDFVIESFFIGMVLIAFYDSRMLFPTVIVFVLVHTLHDGVIHGTVPMETWTQSIIHLFAGGVLYYVIKLKNKAYEDKYLLIEKMDLGHAYFKGWFNEQGILNEASFLSVNSAFETLLDKEGFCCYENKPLKDVFKDFPDEWTQAFTNVLRYGEANEMSLYIPSLNKYLRLSFYVPKLNEGAVIIRDITKYKKATKKINYLNRHDPLTGFYNREYLMEMIKTVAIEHKKTIGIIIFDIDNLEILNRMFDTTSGDEAINLAAETIKKSSHKDHYLFRYGGDEFVLLSTNPDINQLKSLARKVELEFSSKDVNQISLTMTSGVAVKRKNDEDKETILAEAEKALYNRKTIQMNSTHIQTLKGLLELLTAKFSYEKAHSEHVSRLSQNLAESLELTDLEIQEARVAAMFHDIGKIAIADAILGKPSKLTDEEYETIKQHASIGYKILLSAAPKTHLCDYVLHHHERFDGLGYPNGLSGEDIPLISRIINVVDAYEAMTSKREYSPPMSQEEAIEEIKANMGTQFDPHVAKTFITKTLKRKEG